MAGTCYFVIVGTHDGPLYEVELGPGSMAPLAGGDPPYGVAPMLNPATNLLVAGAAHLQQTGAALGVAGTPVAGSSAVLSPASAAATGHPGDARGGGGGSMGSGAGSGAPPLLPPALAGYASTDARRRDENKHLAQFIAYAALDSVADARWLTPQAYLKVIDKFNEWLVSAYIGADGARLVLLHENLHSDGIRSFFHDVQEALVKVILNPFHDVNAPILSTAFDQRVRAAARKYL